MTKTQQSPLIGQNILNLDVTVEFYKGCCNEKAEAIEMYRTSGGFLVVVDNIVVHASESRRDALVRYGEHFGEE